MIPDLCSSDKLKMGKMGLGWFIDGVFVLFAVVFGMALEHIVRFSVEERKLINDRLVDKAWPGLAR